MNCIGYNNVYFYYLSILIFKYINGYIYIYI